MQSNKRSFLIGCLIGLVPVIIYGHLKIKTERFRKYELNYSNVSYISSETITSNQNSPATTKEPEPTIIQKPTETPTPLPKEEQLPNHPQTALYEIQKPSAPEDIHQLIERYSSEYGANKDMMIIIAKCESGFRAEATNGSFAGIYQFLGSTWKSNRNAMGLDPNPDLRFNAEESVKTAAFKMGRDGYGAWPVCSKKAYRALDLASIDIQ